MIKNFTCLCCLILVLAFSSCKKDDTTVTDPSISYVSVINASPSLATYNLYLNDIKANNNGALPLGGVVNYLEVASGTYTAKFTSASSTESLLTKTINLSGSTVYSYFLIGEAGQLDGVMAKDVMTAVTDQASVRFVNMTPGESALNLIATTDVVEEEDNSVVTNLFYKSVSDFVALAPKTYTFEVKDKTTGAVITTLSNVTLAAGKYYTVLVRGMVTPNETQHPVAAQLITNL